MTQPAADKDLPILWSFRRCPYAIRARMALLGAGLTVALREIALGDKPPDFLAASASATVPTLVAGDTVLDESLDIMVWALERHDPTGLLRMPDAGWSLIAQCDGPFKTALDHTKYAVRYPALDPLEERAKAAAFLQSLEAHLDRHACLLGADCTLADLAVFPFVRQFAFIDRAWFDAQPWPRVVAWLDRFLRSPTFETAMVKAPVWQTKAAPVVFGPLAQSPALP